RYGALAIENFSNSVRRHAQLAGELRGTHVERFKLLGKMLSRMNCCARHGLLLEQFRRKPCPACLRRMTGSACRDSSESRHSTLQKIRDTYSILLPLSGFPG